MPYIVTLRLPETIATRCYECTNIADAGFRVRAPHKVEQMPDTTGWVSVRVECPKPLTTREAYNALRALETCSAPVSMGSIIGS
jgi:hypothetical protein